MGQRGWNCEEASDSFGFWVVKLMVLACVLHTDWQAPWSPVFKLHVWKKPDDYSPRILIFLRLLDRKAPSAAVCMRAKSHQSCLTLCNPMDQSLPGSSVHEILQVRILKWVAISFSTSCHSQVKRRESPDCCLLKIIQVQSVFSVLDSGNILRL